MKMGQAFRVVWTNSASETLNELMEAATKARKARTEKKRTKASKQEGRLKQVVKCLELLASNPRHPGLETHEFTSLDHPYRKGEKIFEAYAQNRTPGAYRVFWCYGPSKGEITIIAITPHP
jgi:ERCC4-type nuclease